MSDIGATPSRGLSPCGWCGRPVDWERTGELHYEGVCVGKQRGWVDAVLSDYHCRGYGKSMSSSRREVGAKEGQS